MKEIHCGEFIAGCPHISRGRTEEELMAGVREHAARDHGGMTIDENLRSELIKAIKER